jgi:spore germination protein YaaH
MKGFDEPLVATPDERLLRQSRAGGVKLLPLLSNLSGNEWQPEIVEDLARHPEKRPPFFKQLADQLLEMDAVGVLVDWEQVDPAYRQGLTGLLRELAGYLHGLKLDLWLCIPVGNDIAAFDLDALAPAVDRFVAQLYDENGEDDSPGPLASQPWWTEWLDAMLEHGSPEQWIIGIGNYGYDWPKGKDATALGFADTMARIRVAKPQVVTAEAPRFQPHFNYDESGIAHSVWFLDAATFRNQYVAAMKRGGEALPSSLSATRIRNRSQAQVHLTLSVLDSEVRFVYRRDHAPDHGHDSRPPLFARCRFDPTPAVRAPRLGT